ncbi:hypothetical protein PCL_03668 [Purpureocillium lilacinum]|uniref:Uncharacterized protein n=1 Tax=Purpureocillium lilacinum TaxID=33203 RepID=A0A2U3EPP2_PURLI|nr:hypothetical protein PCL_03668 [Purpureocillium lilacinum]
MTLPSAATVAARADNPPPRCRAVVGVRRWVRLTRHTTRPQTQTTPHAGARHPQERRYQPKPKPRTGQDSPGRATPGTSSSVPPSSTQPLRAHARPQCHWRTPARPDPILPVRPSMAHRPPVPGSPCK